MLHIRSGRQSLRSRCSIICLGGKLVSFLRFFVRAYPEKNFSVFFCDRVTFYFLACAVQPFAAFEIEGESVLAAADHLVPDVAFFQRRALVRTPSLNRVQNSGAA